MFVPSDTVVDVDCDSDLQGDASGIISIGVILMSLLLGGLLPCLVGIFAASPRPDPSAAERPERRVPNVADYIET